MKRSRTRDETTPGEIVVVDDTPANLQLLVDILIARGYRVRPVTSGAAALRAIRSHPPDLVLLDIDMPGMNGIETCRRIKAMECGRDLPIVFISVISDGVEKVNAFACGGVDYITKPFDVDEVLARVGTHVALSRSRRSLADTLARLRELESMRDMLTHMIAHDMRSPLLTVRLAMDLLAPVVPAGDAHRARAAANGQACVASLLDMVTRMIELSRLEQTDMPLQLADTDLAAVARDTLARVRGRAAGRTLHLLAGAPVRARVDADVMRRVMENLVDNAVKFTGEAGRIEVDLAIEGEDVLVTVRDDGPGVPPGDRERIFTKFVQGPPHADSRGFGLGLAFVRLAVGAHGGSVGVHSGPGMGSEFWCRFPANGSGVSHHE